MPKAVRHSMISTGNISKIIKRELYYQWHSKSVAMLFIILLCLNIIHLVGLYDGVISAYERFKNTENIFVFCTSGFQFHWSVQDVSGASDKRTYGYGRGSFVCGCLPDAMLCYSAQTKRIQLNGVPLNSTRGFEGRRKKNGTALFFLVMIT